MNYRRTPLRAVEETALCNCGGELKFGGVCLTSCPAQYPHKCERCGQNTTLRHASPRIVYEPEPDHE